MDDLKPGADAPGSSSLARRALALAGEYRGPVALVVVLIVGILIGGKTPDGRPIFLTGSTHVSVFFEYAEYGILAAGMTLVILTGGIDLSVGSVLGLSSVVFAILTLGCGWSSQFAALAAAGVGAVCGLINGLLISRLRFQPFVATLAMMVVARGLAKQVTGHRKIAPALDPWYHVRSLSDMPAIYKGMMSPLAKQGIAITVLVVPALIIAAAAFLRYTATGRALDARLFGSSSASRTARAALSVAAWAIALGLTVWGLAPYLQPASFLFVSSLLLMALVVKVTRFGRHLYAIGGNEEAARLSGVPVARSKVLAYVLCGLFSGLAGIVTTCRLQLGNPEAGATYELDAIAAVVIGGTSLMGGRGSVALTLVGALIMGYANKILSNIQIHGQFLQDGAKLLAKGMIIVLAVLVQEARRRRA